MPSALPTSYSQADIFTARDLRGDSKDYLRDRNHTAKWAYGENTCASGGHAPLPEGKRRPVSVSMRQSSKPPVGGRVRCHRESIVRKFDILSELNGPSGLASPTSEYPSAATYDAGITYSFDAVRGPRGGSQVLGLALAKAVEKFERSETERIINDEYEVLDEYGEAKPVSRKRGRGAASKAKTTEDDYEIV